LLPIPDDAVDLSFPAPQYENDFASIVGNAATDSDGFDADFNDASAVLIDFPNFLSGLDIALGLLDASMPGVDTPWEQDFTDTLSNSITQGDPDFAAFDVHMTGNSPPPAGTPPSTGGGGTTGPPKGAVTYTAYLQLNYTVNTGYQSPDIITLTVEVDPDAAGHTASGGGGGASGTGGTVYNPNSGNSSGQALPVATVGGAPVSLTFAFQNSYNVNLKFTSVTLGPAGQQLWSADFSALLGNTMQPADVRSLKVIFTPPKAAA
jgi:hypothetical protein